MVAYSHIESQILRMVALLVVRLLVASSGVITYSIIVRRYHSTEAGWVWLSESRWVMSDCSSAIAGLTFNFVIASDKSHCLREVKSPSLDIWRKVNPMSKLIALHHPGNPPEVHPHLTLCTTMFHTKKIAFKRFICSMFVPCLSITYLRVLCRSFSSRIRIAGVARSSMQFSWIALPKTNLHAPTWRSGLPLQSE